MDPVEAEDIPRFGSSLGAAVTSGKRRYGLTSRVVVENRVVCANGWDQPWYHDETDGADYDLGGTVPGTPATSDVAGATHAAGTTLEYYFTEYNSRFDVETAPVSYGHLVGGAPANVQHIFPAAQNAQFDKGRLYRKLPGGNYKLVTTQNAGATYVDNVSNATLLTAAAIVLRIRPTKPPIFAGLIEYQSMLVGWTGKDAIIYFSQTRRPDGSGNVVTDFPPLNILAVAPNDGSGNIRACVKSFEAIYVLKERAIYRITGGPSPLDMDVQLVTADRGCIAQHSVVVINGSVFFLDTEGAFVIPPTGAPIQAGSTPLGNASPLAPFWDRVNLDAAALIHGSHNLRDGTYELLLPIDDEPEPSHRATFDYRSGGDRWTIDPLEGLTVQAPVADNSGLLHLMALDDLGQVLELYLTEADGLPDTGPSSGTVSGGTQERMTTNALWGDALTGTPMQLRRAGAVVETMRVWTANPVNGDVDPLSWSPEAGVAGDKIYVGVIPALLRMSDALYEEPRYEKVLDSTVVLFKKRATSALVNVRAWMDEDTRKDLGTFDTADLNGHAYFAGEGVRGKRLALQIDNADANAGWSVSCIDLSLEVRRAM